MSCTATAGGRVRIQRNGLDRTIFVLVVIRVLGGIIQLVRCSAFTFVGFLFFKACYTFGYYVGCYSYYSRLSFVSGHTYEKQNKTTCTPWPTLAPHKWITGTLLYLFITLVDIHNLTGILNSPSSKQSMTYSGYHLRGSRQNLHWGVGNLLKKGSVLCKHAHLGCLQWADYGPWRVRPPVTRPDEPCIPTVTTKCFIGAGTPLLSCSLALSNSRYEVCL